MYKQISARTIQRAIIRPIERSNEFMNDPKNLSKTARPTVRYQSHLFVSFSELETLHRPNIRTNKRFQDPKNDTFDLSRGQRDSRMTKRTS